MPSFDDLPDELVLGILEHVGDALSMPPLQLISRRFNILIRRNPALWRNALYLERGLSKPTMFDLLVRLRRIAKMSANSIERLGVSFGKCPYFSDNTMEGTVELTRDHEMMHIFAETLQTLPQLKDLYIDTHGLNVMGHQAAIQVTGEELCKLLNLLHFNRLRSLVVHVRDMRQSSIHLFSFHELEKIHFLQDATGLEMLRLECCYWPAFFRNAGDTCRFTGLARLQISNVEFSGQRDVRSLYAMLEAVQGTLYELELDVESNALPFEACLFEPGFTGQQEVRTLTFANLVKFHFGSDAILNDPTVYGRQLFRFCAPKLRTNLSVDFFLPAMLFNDLFTPQVTEVHVSQLCFRLERFVETVPFVNVLRQCTSLKRVFIRAAFLLNQSHPSHFLQSIQDVSFSELTLLIDCEFPMNDLTALLQHRSGKAETRTRKLTICDASNFISNRDGDLRSAFEQIDISDGLEKTYVEGRENIFPFFPPRAFASDMLYHYRTRIDVRNEM